MLKMMFSKLIYSKEKEAYKMFEKLQFVNVISLKNLSISVIHINDSKNMIN